MRRPLRMLIIYKALEKGDYWHWLFARAYEGRANEGETMPH